MRESLTFGSSAAQAATRCNSRRLVRFYISTDWYYDLTWFGPAAEAESEEVKRLFASFTLMAPATMP